MKKNNKRSYSLPKYKFGDYIHDGLDLMYNMNFGQFVDMVDPESDWGSREMKTNAGKNTNNIVTQMTPAVVGTAATMGTGSPAAGAGVTSALTAGQQNAYANKPPQMAYGGNVSPNAEVEGEEIINHPANKPPIITSDVGSTEQLSQTMTKIKGPSHENGGVDINGQGKVFSARLAAISKRMEPLAKQLGKIEKALKNRPQDKQLLKDKVSLEQAIESLSNQQNQLNAAMGNQQNVPSYAYGTDGFGQPPYATPNPYVQNPVDFTSSEPLTVLSGDPYNGGNVVSNREVTQRPIELGVNKMSTIGEVPNLNAPATLQKRNPAVLSSEEELYSEPYSSNKSAVALGTAASLVGPAAQAALVLKKEPKEKFNKINPYLLDYNSLIDVTSNDINQSYNNAKYSMNNQSSSQGNYLNNRLMLESMRGRDLAKNRTSIKMQENAANAQIKNSAINANANISLQEHLANLQNETAKTQALMTSIYNTGNNVQGGLRDYSSYEQQDALINMMESNNFEPVWENGKMVFKKKK